jgi:hypothetical protein
MILTTKNTKAHEKGGVLCGGLGAAGHPVLEDPV